MANQNAPIPCDLKTGDMVKFETNGNVYIVKDSYPNGANLAFSDHDDDKDEWMRFYTYDELDAMQAVRMMGN